MLPQVGSLQLGFQEHTEGSVNEISDHRFAEVEQVVVGFIGI